MKNTLAALVNFDDSNCSILQLFRLKTGEKLTKKQIAKKINLIESELISLGAKLIMDKIIEDNTVPFETKENDLLIELAADDTDTEARTNKLVQWVHESAQDQDIREITNYIIQLSAEVMQLEILSRNPLLTNLN